MRFLLKSIQIEGFRGINNSGSPLTLDFAVDKVNSVFASNAQGKSSVFQALAFALTGNVKGLADLHRGEDAVSYVVNRFHPTHTGTVSIQVVPDNNLSSPLKFTITITPDGSRTVTGPPEVAEPQLFLRSLAGPFTLLDYNTFQRFVADSPLDRGRTFSGLLGLSRLSEVRQALDTLQNTVTFNRDFRISELTAAAAAHRDDAHRAQEEVSRLLGAISPTVLPTPLTPPLARAIATDALRRHPELLSYWGESPEPPFETLKRSLQVTEQAMLTNEASTLLARINQLTQLRVAGAEFDERRRAIALAIQLDEVIAVSPGLQIRDALRTSLAVLQSPGWPDSHQCPVCETTNDRDLVVHLQQHLGAFQAVDDTAALLTEAVRLSNWFRCFGQIFHQRELEPTGEERAVYGRLSAAIANASLRRGLLEESLEALDGLRERLIVQLNALILHREEVVARLPQSLVALVSTLGVGEQIFARCVAWEESLAQEARVRRQLERREEWRSFVARAASEFADAETALSASRISALEPLYRDLYATIVPGNDVVPKLARSPDGEDVFLLLENFYGLPNLKAPALLSEAYRNALAISLYLSAALTTPHVSGFMVLDDVSSSFDAGLQYFLMDVFRTKVRRGSHSSGLQVIFLSHDGTLEKYFDRLSNEGDWTNQKLFGRPPVGLVQAKERDGARLREAAVAHLSTGDDNAAGPIVRQYLESAVLEVLRRLNIGVPVDFAVHDSRKMLDAGLTSIERAVGLHKAAGSLVLSQLQCDGITQVVLPATLGNSLAHFPTSAGHGLSVVVLEGAMARVDQFLECFQYECTCDGTSRKRFYRSLTARQCSCH
jgi:hypothetical protein